MNTHQARPTEGTEAVFRPTVMALQMLTIAWMSVETGLATLAGIRAHSVALTAFAGDSVIELLSALVVLRRFRLGPRVERAATQGNAALLYLLAAYIIVTSCLSLVSRRFEAHPSVLGLGLLIAAAIVMPLLGSAKKKIAAKTGSNSLKADAAQSNLCGYMSLIALAGIFINFMFKLPWADSVAAICLLPLVLRKRTSLVGVRCANADRLGGEIRDVPAEGQRTKE